MASVQKCFSSLSHERFLPFQQQLNNLDTKQGEETGVKLSVSNWRQPPIIFKVFYQETVWASTYIIIQK